MDLLYILEGVGFYSDAKRKSTLQSNLEGPVPGQFAPGKYEAVHPLSIMRNTRLLTTLQTRLTAWKFQLEHLKMRTN